MFVSYATAQGPRPEQQDRVVVTPVKGGQLLAVMDGHGGRQTAEIIAKHLPNLVEKQFWEFRGDARMAYQAIFTDLLEKTHRESSGSSLSAVFIPEGAARAEVAVLGDSPVALLDASNHLRIGPLHNARSNNVDRQAALVQGAEYIDGYLEDPLVPGYGLQLTRALGDRALARILNRNPEIYSVPLGGDSRILLATDGVLDSMEYDLEGQIKRLMDGVSSGKSAQTLVDDALRRQTGDNVSVIIWRA